MNWSSKDNCLRRNNSSTVPHKPLNRPAKKPISIQKKNIDLSIIDERSAKNVSTLNIKVQEIFRNWIAECQILAKTFGFEYKAISGNRTFEEQAKLYAQGRSSSGKIVTNAKPGFSNHNFGIAVDMGVFRNGKYLDELNPSDAESFHRKAAQIGEKYNIEWGGNWKTFKDYPHFEYKTGKTLAQLRQLINENKDII
jgi:peptidoglycan L-alanyl-D-glutamate endopeptidase CwlK